jgi:hypothetical protein
MVFLLRYLVGLKKMVNDITEFSRKVNDPIKSQCGQGYSHRQCVLHAA